MLYMFFFKQKTAYDMRISYWSSDVCSSDLVDAVDKLFNHGGVAANPTMGDSIDGNSASGTREGKTSIIGEGEPHAHSITIDAGGSHTHTGSTASSGHIPPFFAKIYIMRVS